MYALLPYGFIGFMKTIFVGKNLFKRNEDFDTNELTDWYGRPVFNPLEGLIMEDLFLGISFWFISRVFDFTKFNNVSMAILALLLFGLNSCNFAFYGLKNKKRSRKWSFYAFSFITMVLGAFLSLFFVGTSYDLKANQTVFLLIALLTNIGATFSIVFSNYIFVKKRIELKDKL